MSPERVERRSGCALRCVQLRCRGLRDDHRSPRLRGRDASKRDCGDPQGGSTAVLTIQPAAPRELAWLIRSCLAKNPDDRWQSAHDLQLELGWLADKLRQPTNISDTTRKRQSRRRRPRSTQAAAASILRWRARGRYSAPRWRAAALVSLVHFSHATAAEHRHDAVAAGEDRARDEPRVLRRSGTRGASARSGDVRVGHE
jgi:hypothetical protein